MDAGSGSAEYDYAGFWPRLAAGIIDFVIMSILPAAWIGVALVVFGLPMEIPEARAFDQIYEMQQTLDHKRAAQLSQHQRMAGWASNIFGVVFVIGFWTWKGQTPGKMVFHIRIIRTDGKPIGLVTSILRYVGQFIGLTLLCLGFFMIAWDKKKQALHDKIARTYVVKI